MADMPLNDAIAKRRSVRSFTDTKIDADTIHALLAAAVQAPTAMHEEPWEFLIIQDRKLLGDLSVDAKKLLMAETQTLAHGAHALHLIRDPDFNIFYNAGTLIVICGKPMGPFVVADCWLAAENLLLAACARGLGSCVIGFSVNILNRPEWKSRLGIKADMTAYAPIIVGVPDGHPPPVARKKPEILAWLKGDSH
jgi:nitroreductase